MSSLRDNCGINLPSVLAFSVITLQLTTRKPMAWLNDSTATSKPHLQHDLQHPLERKNFHGFCWNCVPRLKRISVHLPLNWSMVPPSPCQESSLCPILHRIHHTPVSCASSAALLTLFGQHPHLPMVNTAHTCQQASNRLVLFLFVVTHTSLHCNHLMMALFLWFLGIPSTFSSTSEAGKTKRP